MCSIRAEITPTAINGEPTKGRGRHIDDGPVELRGVPSGETITISVPRGATSVTVRRDELAAAVGSLSPRS